MAAKRFLSAPAVCDYELEGPDGKITCYRLVEPFAKDNQDCILKINKLISEKDEVKQEENLIEYTYTILDVTLYVKTNDPIETYVKATREMMYGFKTDFLKELVQKSRELMKLTAAPAEENKEEEKKSLT